jgi:hypothetical protein
VADFGCDGWEDPFVTAGREQADDDSTDLSMAEVRLGPFSTTGRGRTRDVGIEPMRRPRHVLHDGLAHNVRA